MHKQGIALWGGKSWSKIARFAHPGVKSFDFSPNEKYMTTYSSESFTKDGELYVSQEKNDEILFHTRILSGNITRVALECPVIHDESWNGYLISQSF